MAVINEYISLQMHECYLAIGVYSMQENMGENGSLFKHCHFHLLATQLFKRIQSYLKACLEFLDYYKQNNCKRAHLSTTVTYRAVALFIDNTYKHLGCMQTGGNIAKLH